MEKKYTFWQKLIAAFANRSVESYYATNVEKTLMWYESLSDKEKEEFKNKMK